MNQPALFDTAADLPFVLWHRATRRHKWREVGRGETQLAVVCLMSGSGEYVVRADGTGPEATVGGGDEAEATRATV